MADKIALFASAAVFADAQHYTKKSGPVRSGIFTGR